MRAKVFGPAALALAASVCLLAAPPRAAAQGQTWVGGNLQRMVESARWRLGALRLNAAFTLANAGYDSDVYYGFLAEPTPDVTARAAVPIQVILPLSKKAVIEVSDTPGYDFYLDQARQRSFNNVLDGRVHFAFNKIYLQAGGGASDVRRRLSPELELNVRQKVNRVSGVVLYQASQITSLALIYNGSQISLDDSIFVDGRSLADRLNRNVETVDLAGYVQPSPRFRLSLDGQYGSYQFRRSGPEFRDAVSYAFFASADFIPDISIGELDIQRGLAGTLALGFQMIDMKDPGRKDGSGLVGEATVTARLSKRMSGHLLFSRGFQFSIYSGSSFYLSTSMGARLTRHLSRKTSLSYGFSYGLTTYPGTTLGGESDPNRFYRYLTHTLRLSVRLERHLDASFYGTFGQRDRGGTATLRSRFFGGLSLTYGFIGGGMTAPRGGIR